MKRSTFALVAVPCFACFCVAAACATFTEAEEAPDASVGDANPGDGAALPDDASACPTDRSLSFSLDAFKGAGGDGGTLDGGSLFATATAVPNSSGFDFRFYALAAVASLDLDYELTVTGVAGAYVETGCDVVLFHSAAFEPLTRLFYTHDSARNFFFRTQRVPGDAGPPESKTVLEALGTTPVKRHVHLHIDISSRLTGTAAWEGTPPATIDQPLEPVARLEIICGVYFASFADGGSFSTTTSELTGTACRPP